MTMARPTRPSIGEVTRVNSEIELRGAQRRLDRGHRRRRLLGGRGPAFALLGGHGVLAGQPLGPLQLGGSALHRRAGPRQVGGEAIDLRLEGPRVDLEEHLAAADNRALLERHGGDEAGNARPDVDRVHRLEAAGHFIPLGDVAGHDLGHGDLGGRWLALLCGRAGAAAEPAGGESRGDEKRGQAAQEAARRGVHMTFENGAPNDGLHNRAQGRRRARPKAAASVCDFAGRPASAFRTRLGPSRRPMAARRGRAR